MRKKTKERISTEAAMRKATEKNRRAVLLTASQVKKWWNIPQSYLDRVPVAMVINGEPRYIEYQVDLYGVNTEPEDCVEYNVLDR